MSNYTTCILLTQLLSGSHENYGSVLNAEMSNLLQLSPREIQTIRFPENFHSRKNQCMFTVHAS